VVRGKEAWLRKVFFSRWNYLEEDVGEWEDVGGMTR